MSSVWTRRDRLPMRLDRMLTVISEVQVRINFDAIERERQRGTVDRRAALVQRHAKRTLERAVHQTRMQREIVRISR